MSRYKVKSISLSTTILFALLEFAFPKNLTRDKFLKSSEELSSSEKVRASKRKWKSARLLRNSTFKYPLIRQENAYVSKAKGLLQNVNNKLMVANHVIVKRNINYSEEELINKIEFEGYTVLQKIPALYLYLIQIPDSQVDENAVPIATAKLMRFNEVSLAGFNGIGFTEATTPDDAHFPWLWGLNNPQDMDIDAPEAWDLNVDSSNFVVAVVDSGIQVDHPDLSANLWVNPDEIQGDNRDNDGNGLDDDIHGFDFYNWEGAILPADGHGTHVAGIISAAGNNGVGVTGVGWNTRLMALKITSDYGYLSFFDIMFALNYAWEKKVKIINISWTIDYDINLLDDNLRFYRQYGMLFVCAAGNEGINLDENARFPSSLSNNDNVISVGAFSTEGLRAYNYGPKTVSLAAPGVSVYSTFPTDTYDYKSGTSMAAAYASGACALLWSAYPYLTYQQVRELIMLTTDPIASWDGFSITGGKLNIYNALKILTNSHLDVVSAELDGDGLCAPGETVKMTIKVQNIGKLSANNVNATLSTTHPEFEILNGSLAIGNLSSEQAITPADTFSVKVNNPELKTLVDFNITLTDSNGKTNTETFTYNINTPLKYALDTDTGSILEWKTDGANFDYINWFAQSDQTFDGIDAAQSGAIPHGRRVSMKTQITGPAFISWRWKVSSETSYDQLTYYRDDFYTRKISGDVDYWVEEVSFLDVGTHEIMFVYTKDGAISHGLDAGWVDNVKLERNFLSLNYQLAYANSPFLYHCHSEAPSTFSAENLPEGLNLSPQNSHLSEISGTPNVASGMYPIELTSITASNTYKKTFNLEILEDPNIALDTDNKSFYLYGRDYYEYDPHGFKYDTLYRYPWRVQTTNTYDGIDAMQSAVYPAGTVGGSTLRMAYVSGPAELSFWCKLSAPENNGVLRITLDRSTILKEIKGNVDWTNLTFNISSGPHYIDWQHFLDTPNNDPKNHPRAYLDKVEIRKINTTFSSWIADTRLNPRDYDPQADPDRDQIPNALEYIQNTNPNSIPWRPPLEKVMDYLNIQYDPTLNQQQLIWRQRSGGSGTRGINYRWNDTTIHLEICTNLLNNTWAEASAQDISEVSTTLYQDHDTEEVRVKILSPLAEEKTKYIRLRVDID